MTAHYPSWGSGTGAGHPVALAKTHTHYPSWGSGTRFSPARNDDRDAVSLPLMGIGNPAGRIRPRGCCRLITPHGDRERVVRGAEGQERHHLITPHGDRELDVLDQLVLSFLDLITPHGDRERVDPPLRDAAYLHSLPLMGIGNPQAHGALDALAVTAHYPSWGSGTWHRQGVGTWFAVAHYPSWGSGTRRPATGTRSPRSHYPSWGSGTASSTPRLDGACRSLPLMGIGNLFRWTCRRLHQHLITPHGDRERRM